MRLLAIVAPYQGTPPRLHLNRRGDVVMIATDRIVDYLLARGHQVVYCMATGEACPKPAYCSGLPLYTEHEIKNWDFDLIWHCVKDPTPPEFVEAIQRITAKVGPSRPIINDVAFLRNWTKPFYYPFFGEKELPMPVIQPESTEIVEVPGRMPQFLRLADRNNDRERGKPIVVNYIDNIADGFRSFFRVPYCAGRVLPGVNYFFPADQYVTKTATAVRSEPFVVHLQVAIKIATALSEHGVGIAHVEGFSKPDGGIRGVFDVNPFPCSDGITFDPMSQRIAERLEHVYNI